MYSLSRGGNIDVSRLGERGDTGSAVGLDGEVVGVHLNSEEATLAPVGAPGVSADPVLSVGSLVEAPSDHGDLVVDLGP